MKWMQKSLAVMMLALFSIAFAQACATSGKGEDDDDKPGFEKDYVKTSAGSPVFKPVQWGPDVRPPRLDARTNEGRQTKVNENIEGVKSRPETKTKYDKLTDRQKQCMAFHIAYLQAVMYQDIISPKAPAKVHADAKAVTDYYKNLLDYWCSNRDPGVGLYNEYVINYVGKANAKDSLVRRVQNGDAPPELQLQILSKPSTPTRTVQEYIKLKESEGISAKEVGLGLMALGIFVGEGAAATYMAVP
jgi:hypothetical protein